MSDGPFFVLCVLIAIGGIFGFGYFKAHSEIAAECQRLGAFYVGDKTFKLS